MSINIENHEAQRPRTRRIRSAEDAEARLAELHRELAGQPVLDPRMPDEFLGYDDNGLPR